MPRLTRPSRTLTTRKRSCRRTKPDRVLVCMAGLSAVLALTGCSTPGPTHAYLASVSEHRIIDRGPNLPDVEIATHLVPINDVYGIAYDPFTDHLFLRVYPGNFIRVIDRPANHPKRAFPVVGLPEGPGDLAIRSSDRHLFFAHPSRPAILETTLYGIEVRTITLANVNHPPAGVAYDQTQNRLLILSADQPTRVHFHNLDGHPTGFLDLDHALRPVSLAYDSTATEIYAPLRDQSAIGVFDNQGRLQRTLPFPDGRSHELIDVGPRSLIRLF